MHIERLRLLGFKSFVEPTELVIQRGLTGVVGPNGCGKSNLLEALRWVMGETSHKSMRAAAMDDVIFSGTQSRPSRNWAEVAIFLDNRDRKAPAGFNDSDVIEIARRIEREAGSAYRINGRDARARDIKLLFEDAATGARSPALVRQGQIGEIVNAKPDQRRRILEDAAGIAGLHSRRHEAELRLKAAEANLARIGDVLGQIGAQLEALKRQARQARRYKEISTEIRKAEAIVHYLGFAEAEAAVTAEEAALAEILKQLAEAMATEGAATRAEAGAAESIPPLREAEATRAAVLARIRIEQEKLELEAARAAERLKELEARRADVARDREREEAQAVEAKEQFARLESEIAALAASAGVPGEAEQKARRAAERAGADLQEAEERLSELTTAAAEERARRRQLEAVVAERTREVASLEQDVARSADALAGVERTGVSDHAAAREAVDVLALQIEDTEQATEDAEAALARSADALRQAREAGRKAVLEANRLKTEMATLAKLLVPPQGRKWPPVVDALKVADGYEAALGAALGDDLEAPVSAQSPAHWRDLGAGNEDAALPPGAAPLCDFVDGAAELSRRLKQVGIVEASHGDRLQPLLEPGQRLVSTAGDLWRWDGFTRAANAPSAAARRLAERNRMERLECEEAVARNRAEAAEAAERTAVEAHAKAEAEERRLRQQWRDTQAKLAAARERLHGIERAEREATARSAALAEGKRRAEVQLALSRGHLQDARTALADLGAADASAVPLAEALADVARLRPLASEARAVLSGLERDRKLSDERRDAAERERERWSQRSAGSAAQLERLRQRAAEIVAELNRLAELPAAIDDRRQRLLIELAAAENARSAAADRLAAAETALREAGLALKAAQAGVTAEREARAAGEARLDGARTRQAQKEAAIREGFGCSPGDCLALAGLEPEGPLPVLADTTRVLERLKGDRERLGGVNLSAEEELAEIGARFETLDKERLDLEEAIAKLRNGIAQLNREGKKRLNDAFATVNGHFQRLFGILFGGGEAELQLIEGEDPLESGLEIVAKPPGKKPATLSLLSGGEQTLTALSLIFAVFLTNPSPICVLDEVDAPLDDANVDRFCNMMESMASGTDTRFLVITHHPMTMSRMNRLFGVTMAERGVSQLVSVDLSTAERFVEADAASA